VERIDRQRLPSEPPNQFDSWHIGRPWALTWSYFHIPGDTLHG
jgi:hypothetical protein